MSRTIQDTIFECRRRLLTASRPEINLLTTALSDTTGTAVTLTDPVSNIGPGARISIDLENMFVRSVSATTGTLTVIRGFDGSTAATHTANTQVWVNPVFSDFDILSAINDDLADLASNGMYQMLTKEIQFVAATRGYDLGSLNILDVYDVRFQTPGPLHNWPRVNSWTYLAAADTTDFASGKAIVLNRSAYPGLNFQVIYKSPFTAGAAYTDDMQTTVGLPASANDLPALGATIHLLAGREVKRNLVESQGDPRRYEEVPAGASLHSVDRLAALRQARLAVEVDRLRLLYPVLKHRPELF